MRDRLFAAALRLMTAICLSLLLSDAIAATLPDNLIISPKAHPHYVIIVEKASQRVFVYQFNGDYRLVASFPCATGENGGDKQTSGDRRTPEGIYFFTKACDSSFLSATYGARAFPMNYPNPMDERRDKGGYSIWLHGTKEKLKDRSTNGCIAMNNADVVRLDPYIKLWDTPIIIQENLNLREVDASREEGQTFLEEIEGWRQAWSEKDLDRYLSYYSSAFRWQNLDLQGWRQKKERLNRAYQAIQVQLGNIRFFRQGGYGPRNLRRDLPFGPLCLPRHQAPVPGPELCELADPGGRLAAGRAPAGAAGPGLQAA